MVVCNNDSDHSAVDNNSTETAWDVPLFYPAPSSEQTRYRLLSPPPPPFPLEQSRYRFVRDSTFVTLSSSLRNNLDIGFYSIEAAWEIPLLVTPPSPPLRNNLDIGCSFGLCVRVSTSVTPFPLLWNNLDIGFSFGLFNLACDQWKIFQSWIIFNSTRIIK